MEHPIMFDEDDPVLAALRARVLALPGAVETITFGRPWWRTQAPKGRVFGIYGGGTKGPEKVPHPRALLVLIDPDELPARMQDQRFFVPAYFGPRGWLGIDVDAPDTDWTEVDELLDAAFRCVAPKVLLQELDSRV
jgi:hypothetical protein